MKIVCGTDLSVHAEEAANVAAALAVRCRSAFTLVHAVEEMSKSALDRGEGFKTMGTGLRSRA